MNDIFKKLDAVQKQIKELREANMKRAMKEAKERKDHGHINNR